MSYYNTVPVDTGEATERHAAALKQQDQVLAYLKQMGPASASQIYYRFLYSGVNVPLTSVRRALSDLYAEGEVADTGDRRMGIYGHTERIWRAL